MKDSLLKLGFSEKEATVFLTLVQLGPTPASVIARRAKINRTSVYDILNSLTARQVITSFLQGKVQYFYVDDIKKLILNEREQLKEAERFVEQLSQARMSSDLHLTYYKGREGFKELYNDILRAKPKEFIGWVNLDLFYKQLDPEFEAEWTKKRIRSGIKARLLMQRSALTEHFKSEDKNSERETRFIPKNHPFSTSCLLYKPFVVFFNPKGDVAGVRLQDPDFFEMQKAIFEMNWSQLTS